MVVGGWKDPGAAQFQTITTTYVVRGPSLTLAARGGMKTSAQTQEADSPRHLDILLYPPCVI